VKANLIIERKGNLFFFLWSESVRLPSRIGEFKQNYYTLVIKETLGFVCHRL